MKNSVYIFCCVLFSTYAFSQTSLNEEVKIDLIQSLIEDGEIYCLGDSYNDYINCFEFIYYNTVINTSEVIEGEFSNEKKKLHTFYSIKVYKIKSRLNLERIIISYKDIESSAWYRLTGYKENDFIHFYKRILLKYFSEKEINKIISEWQQKEILFNDIEFECLINGVKNRTTNLSCYLSVVLDFESKINDTYNKNQLFNTIYAKFSRRPYKGTMPELNSKLKRKDRQH